MASARSESEAIQRRRGAGPNFGPFCPLARRNMKTANDDGDCKQDSGQKPENKHRAQAPRAVPTRVLRVVGVINQ